MTQPQTETLPVQHGITADSALSTAKKHVLTPAEVLSWLPSTATPAQMDSAIRTHIKPSEIEWSQCPDTLHLPGWPAGKSYQHYSLPLFYKESFFAKDSLFHPELQGGRPGVAGTPIPYSIANDNFFVSILMGCFILIMIAFAQSKEFFIRQTKKFFHNNRNTATTIIPETANEIRYQIALIIQTCLMLGLSFFFYTRTYISNTFIINTYQVVGIYVGIIVLYFILKLILSWIVNCTFFTSKENLHIQKTTLFVSATEGIVLFPIIILQIFLEIPINLTLFYVCTIIVCTKILTLYKQFVIFFSINSFGLQIILYFCALEIVPLLILCGSLTIINGYLKIDF